MSEQIQSTLSPSQQRRLDRKKEALKMKQAAKRNKIIGIASVCVIGLGIAALVGTSIYKSAIRVKPSSEYSKYLTDGGTIEDINASDYVTIPTYTGISVPASAVSFTEEELEAEIKSTVLSYAELDTTTTNKIADGDKVNIDYIGKIDGVEFEGGNSNGAGSDLVIGSNTFIDNFEQQLIGMGVNEESVISVTFPEDYHNAEYAGLAATFDVVVHGIYSSTLTDEIVQEHLSEFATTAEEYRTYVKETRIDEKLTTYLDDFLTTNTTITSYPEKYVKHLKSLKKYEKESEYQYMQQLYASMGYAGPSNFEEYLQTTEAEYDKTLQPAAEETVKNVLIYQAIYEAEGLDIPVDYFDEADSESLIGAYGKGSVMQQVLKTRVLDFIKESVIIL